jgi:3-methyl-2-oxobutanoate hydroxymethyltransferase
MAWITAVDIRKKKAESSPIVMVTAYDATMARLVEAGGADMVLVGDSLGMVIQGHENTLPVTLDDMVYHTRCVSRGLKRAHLIADMPFMSYQVSAEQALVSAGRLVQEGFAHSVKLEGGERSAPAIERIVQAGIPVVGHVGLTPQSTHAMGGFKVQGRTPDAAEQVYRDAVAVAEAGAFCVVLEGMPSDVAARITAALPIPTVGIGAGPSTDGQVLVCNDILGMNLDFRPRFVKRYAELQTEMVAAFAAFGAEVRDRSFPTDEHSFQAAAPAKIQRLY